MTTTVGPTAATAAAAGWVLELPLDLLDPAPDNPRRSLGDLDELAATIRSRGIIEPLVVTARADRYLIVCGHRRHAAATQAGILTVPCIVRDLDDEGRLEVMCIENLQRDELAPLDEAAAYRRLIDSLGWTQTHVARRVGRSEAHVSKRLQLLTLPDPARHALDTGRITIGTALTAARLDDPTDRDHWLAYLAETTPDQHTGEVVHDHDDDSLRRIAERLHGQRAAQLARDTLRARLLDAGLTELPSSEWWRRTEYGPTKDETKAKAFILHSHTDSHVLCTRLEREAARKPTPKTGTDPHAAAAAEFVVAQRKAAEERSAAIAWTARRANWADLLVITTQLIADKIFGWDPELPDPATFEGTADPDAIRTPADAARALFLAVSKDLNHELTGAHWNYKADGPWVPDELDHATVRNWLRLLIADGNYTPTLTEAAALDADGTLSTETLDDDPDDLSTVTLDERADDLSTETLDERADDTEPPAAAPAEREPLLGWSTADTATAIELVESHARMSLEQARPMLEALDAWERAHEHRPAVLASIEQCLVEITPPWPDYPRQTARAVLATLRGALVRHDHPADLIASVDAWERAAREPAADPREAARAHRPARMMGERLHPEGAPGWWEAQQRKALGDETYERTQALSFLTARAHLDLLEAQAARTRAAAVLLRTIAMSITIAISVITGVAFAAAAVQLIGR